MENDELLNIKKNNKNLKKPLVYGAAAFLIFIILVIAYAMYSNSQEENVVLPPQVNEASNQNSDNFQNLAIEEENNE
jgi:DedD protein